KSLELRRIHDPARVPPSLNNLGEIFRITGDYEKAMSYYQESIRLYSQAHDAWGEAASQSNLGLVYAELGDLEKSIGSFERSIRKFAEVGHFDVECGIDYARVLVRVKKTAEAGKILSEIQKEIHSNRSNLNLCKFFLVSGRTEIMKRNLGMANYFLDQAKIMAEFGEFTLLRIEANLLLAETALILSRIDEDGKWAGQASGFLGEAESLATEVRNFPLILELRLFSALLLEAKGNHQEAMSSLRIMLQSNAVDKYLTIKERIVTTLKMLENKTGDEATVNILVYLERIGQLIDSLKH
ncbi:MAG TPA: tetratricopeptide repeat protein, partial [Candidatus Hodarchaeales archaeon]|nr:tetratricopeptide repeat protein [Candidatus Hodarchaeales archaeon]